MTKFLVWVLQVRERGFPGDRSPSLGWEAHLGLLLPLSRMGHQEGAAYMGTQVSFHKHDSSLLRKTTMGYMTWQSIWPKKCLFYSCLSSRIGITIPYRI